MDPRKGDRMTLTLHLHPLSSFCHKVLIALYENDIPFEARKVNLMNPGERAYFLKMSPFGKIPVLEDSRNGRVVLESSVIIEYLQRHSPGKMTLLPSDPERLLEVRLKDRLLDLY